MRAFSQLLDDLVYTRSRNTKLQLIGDYLKETPDPDRGYGLAALTATLDIPHVKPAAIRGLVEATIDPVLFYMSRDYVGDTAETVALLWPKRTGEPTEIDDATISISAAVERLRSASKLEAPHVLAAMLDHLDASGRYALLKLALGELRVGINARLAKQALAQAFGLEIEAVEEVWHGLRPPFTELFDWAEGRSEQPAVRDIPVFRPFMLAHALEQTKVSLQDYAAEWKWDGIRVQLVHAGGETSALQSHGRRHLRELSGRRRSLPLTGSPGRRTARSGQSAGRGPRSRIGRKLQFAPAKARPQERQPEDARRVSGVRAPLRHPVRWRRGFARSHLGQQANPARAIRAPSRSRRDSMFPSSSRPTASNNWKICARVRATWRSRGSC